MTKTERTAAVATQLANHLSYRLGGAFRAESKTIACAAGPDVESVSVVADRAGTWPLVVVSFVDGVESFRMSDTNIVKALGARVAA